MKKWIVASVSFNFKNFIDWNSFLDKIRALRTFKFIGVKSCTQLNINGFTAMKLTDAIVSNPKESRKEQMLNTFEEAGKSSSINFQVQVSATIKPSCIISNY